MLFGCVEEKPNNLIIGSWGHCKPNGEYAEFKITDDHTYYFSSELVPEIVVFRNEIKESTLIIEGTNFKSMYNPVTIDVISKDSIELQGYFGNILLTKLNNEILDVDTSNLNTWIDKVIKNFNKRKRIKDCFNIIAETLKSTELLELGELEDELDSEETIMELPNWANGKFERHKEYFVRTGPLFPNYLESDFSGDGIIDIAIYVKKRANNKFAILIILGGEEEKTYLIGAGNPFDVTGDEQSWPYQWEVFNHSQSYESKFNTKDNAYEVKSIKLDRPAISLKQDEGASGLIYFDGEKFIWINQVGPEN